MNTAVAVAASAGLAVIAAGCGVATRASTSSHSATDQSLAFSHCMRHHGVASFPDPNSSGVWPKSQVDLASGSTKFDAATGACGHLLPDGGPGVSPTPAVVRQIQLDMAKFVRCMRAAGVRNWPDPTLDRGRASFDPEAVRIDASAPRVGAAIRTCERVFPASIGIPPGA